MSLRLFQLFACLIGICLATSNYAHAAPIEVGDRVCVLANHGNLSAAEAEARHNSFDCSDGALSKSASHLWLRIDLAELNTAFPEPSLQTPLAHHGAIVIAPIFKGGRIDPVRHSPAELARESLVPGRNVFPVFDETGTLAQTVLIGIETPWNPLTWSSISLVSHSDALDQSRANTLIYSLLSGILLTPMLLVCLIYQIVRYQFLRYHFAMLACAFVYALSWSGLIFILPIEITPASRSVINNMSVALALFFATHLTRTLCDAKNIGQFWYDILPLAGIVPVISATVFMALAPNFSNTGSMAIYAGISLPLIAIVAALTNGIRNRNRIAQLQLLAWTPMIVYAAGRILNGLGLVGEIHLLELGLFPSLILESLLTSAIVIYRMYAIRLERDAAVKERTALRNLARSDSLTGAMNRRSFVEHFDQTVASGLAASRVLTLVVIDIDHFKKVNDQFGHTVGDEVLVRVTEFLKDHCRGEDAYARFGGEEFCMLISTSTKSAAHACAERLRQAVASHAFGPDLHVTISIGLVTVTADTTTTFTSWFEAADKALYAAKDGGRNQTQWSGWRPKSNPQAAAQSTPEWTLKKA